MNNKVISTKIKINIGLQIFTPDIFCGVHVAHSFSFFVLSYYVYLRSEFRVVMFVTILA
jgi:hypothetical protein